MTIQQEKCKDREVYEAPEAEVLELTAEGVLNINSPGYPNWDSENI